MKAIVNFRKRVMKYAWQLHRTTELTWRECMLKAWEIVRLLGEMREGVVEFAYFKVGGSLRYAAGTLRNIAYGSKSKGKESWSVIRYFDTAKSAFRSFRIENLLYVTPAKSA